MESSSAMVSSTTEETVSLSASCSFRCCVCLELLYKPVVLACGHVSCFWCTHESMDGFKPSRCAMCRRQYNHFPEICELLHLLLLKLDPVSYKSREKEVLEEEKARDCFSPKLADRQGNAEKFDSITLNELEKSSKKHRLDRHIVYSGSLLNERGSTKYGRLSIADVLCSGCHELLFGPSVLNCGHVYCESCIPGVKNGCLKCQICECLHPAVHPTVCWELDFFLQEQFSKEYASRRQNIQIRTLEFRRGESTDSTLENKISAKSSNRVEFDTSKFYEDLSNAHVGVGCDACGMYPIIGARYKCKDCKEKVGFDLCLLCYNTGARFTGRFGQRHALDHRLELDESRLICKIFMRNGLLPDEHSQHHHEAVEDFSESIAVN